MRRALSSLKQTSRATRMKDLIVEALALIVPPPLTLSDAARPQWRTGAAIAWPGPEMTHTFAGSDVRDGEWMVDGLTGSVPRRWLKPTFTDVADVENQMGAADFPEPSARARRKRSTMASAEAPIAGDSELADKLVRGLTGSASRAHERTHR